MIQPRRAATHHYDRKVKATLHWVYAEQCAEQPLANHFRQSLHETPGAASGNMLDDINPDSLGILL